VYSVAIAVSRFLLSLDCVMDFMPMNWHVTRSSNSKPDFVTPDLNDHYSDVITDADFLISLAR
jgi:hypothetical protein